MLGGGAGAADARPHPEPWNDAGVASAASSNATSHSSLGAFTGFIQELYQVTTARLARALTERARSRPNFLRPRVHLVSAARWRPVLLQKHATPLPSPPLLKIATDLQPR